MDFNIYATARMDKKNSAGQVPLYVYVLQGSKVITKHSLRHKVHVDFWDEDSRRVHKKAPLSTLINSLIEKEVSDLKTKILEERITKGAVNIYELLNKEKSQDIDFYEFAERQIKEKNYAEETRRNYRVFVEKIRVFRKSLKLAEINFDFLQGYEAYLRNELKNEPNTVWGNLKFINTLTNDALKFKYIAVDPFKTYTRPKYKQTKRSFLDAKELARFEDFYRTTEDEVLRRVGAYFLFMCFTGLRFSDAIRFKAADHIIDDERIVIETQKTKKVTNLFINEKIGELASFVDANPLGMTQVDYNRKLKLIAAYQGVKKRVSSHVARHSFGKALASMGVSEKVAQGLLAHGSAASTKIYYHLEAQDLDEAMKKFNK